MNWERTEANGPEGYGDPAADRPLGLMHLKGSLMPLPCDGYQPVYVYGVDEEDWTCGRCGFARWAHAGYPISDD